MAAFFFNTPKQTPISSFSRPAFCAIASKSSASFSIAFRNLLSGRPFLLYSFPFSPKTTISFSVLIISRTFLFESHCKARIALVSSIPDALAISLKSSCAPRWGRIFNSNGWRPSIILFILPTLSAAVDSFGYSVFPDSGLPDLANFAVFLSMLYVRILLFKKLTTCPHKLAELTKRN